MNGNGWVSEAKVIERRREERHVRNTSRRNMKDLDWRLGSFLGIQQSVLHARIDCSKGLNIMLCVRGWTYEGVGSCFKPIIQYHDVTCVLSTPAPDLEDNYR
jgi:hypothetical protein